MTYRPFYDELIRQGVKKKDALHQALDLAKQAKEEAEKVKKIEKKQKAKADKKRK